MAALDGVRVLDLSRILAGPYCTGLLAELGADVVKVESSSGDDARHLGPFRDGESIYFAQLNKGKRSITLDLKDTSDLETLYRLADKADVVVENFRPGVTTRLGIDHEMLSERNPRLIYASISGFGQTGPLSQRPAYDLIVQAMSGLMAATGPEGGAPTRVGESVGDVVAGLFAAWSICAALFERERTGAGQHLDVSMLDCLVALQVTGMSILTATGAPPGRVGNRHPISTPFGTYRTNDGLVAIAVANDTVFRRFAALIERPELADDPNYSTDRERCRRVDEVRTMTEAWTSRRSTQEVLTIAEQAGVPAAPIQDLQEAITSDQIQYREMVGMFQHPTLGALPALRQPVAFHTQRDALQPSPSLGEHRNDVLQDWLS